jgi:DNA/RNA-binding domain of Phe-tRNA-synthetase-like protein
MIVRCHREVFEKFPTASIHAVVFNHVTNVDEDISRRWKVDASESVSNGSITLEGLSEFPEFKEWRNAFQRFGVKPSKYRSAVEQLYRRALKGEIIETKLPVVNLYCYVSLIHVSPMGAYDLEKIQGDIAVRLSRDGEEFLGIGEQQPLISDPGVVVYADDAGIICWAWNHRDAARTSLTQQSDKVIFFADSATSDSRVRAAAAIDQLSEILTSAGANKVGAFVLDEINNEATIEL